VLVRAALDEQYYEAYVDALEIVSARALWVAKAL
jgi:hypothetical protein